MKTKPIHVTEELRQAILSRVVCTPGCWEWQGYVDKKGYGKLWVGGRSGRRLAAHRASYAVFAGPIPDGLVIDHLCRNTRCINPDHLEPVPQRTNLLRGESPMATARRTGLCKRGHVRAADTVDRHGHCYRCQADRKMASRRQREAADPALREARLEWNRNYWRRVHAVS